MGDLPHITNKNYCDYQLPVDLRTLTKEQKQLEKNSSSASALWYRKMTGKEWDLEWKSLKKLAYAARKKKIYNKKRNEAMGKAILAADAAREKKRYATNTELKNLTK